MSDWTPNKAPTSEDSSGQRMGAGRHRIAVLALLAIYLSLTLVYGWRMPLGEAPDETAHMDLIRFIGALVTVWFRF